jgi:N-acetylglutamate synthase-like GNAT family acetyltransferase
MARKNVVRVQPIATDRLVSGWSGPGGTHIRLARRSDIEQITGLLALAGIPLDPVVGAVIERGTVASTLLRGLDHGPEGMLRPLAEAVAADRPYEAMPGFVLVLVAEDREGFVRGVLQAVPPDNVLADGINAGVPVLDAVAGATKVAKIRAVAVGEDARGNGIGETLIRRALRTYLQLGFLLIYGQFPVGSGLERYYTRQGFTVLDEGQVIDLRRIGLPILICTDPSDPERMFVRWR